MDFAAWLLIGGGVVIAFVLVLMLRRWRQGDTPSGSDGGFYAADTRRRDEDHDGDGDGGGGD